MLLLWISSIRRKIWNNAPIQEEGLSNTSSYSRICIIVNALSYFVILFVLFIFILFMLLQDVYDSKLLMISIFILCLGGFLASYWWKSTRITFVLNCILFSSLGICLFLIKCIYWELIPTSMISSLILIIVLFIPHFLADCRRALLESPYPQNKGWIHLYLLLCFPSSIALCIITSWSLLFFNIT